MTITLITTGIVITILSLVLLFEKRRVFDFISSMETRVCVLLLQPQVTRDVYRTEIHKKAAELYRHAIQFQVYKLKNIFHTRRN